MRKVRQIFFLSLCFTWRLAAAEDMSAQDFKDRVFPLLQSRCISCHGPEKQQGKLRLDSREALLRGGESGPALMPGNPDGSLLLHAVTHRKKDLEMPPKEKLTPADIALLTRWVSSGAPWPKPAPLTSSAPPQPLEPRGDAWSDPRNPIAKLFNGQRLDLWSLRPLTNVAPPEVRQKAWVRTPVDRFILAALEKAGLSPAPEADRHRLLRRLSFDLTGLPPTPEEMDRFVHSTSPSAYEECVDQLLASPRYGEHAARLWLDVVRYSDSNGFDWDEFRPRAWRYRDYVIRSFNADKPFDQFTREQLAGDELLSGPPRTPGEQDQLIATGYLRLGPHDNSAASFNEQDRSRAELLADLTETTASAFLGLSMGCCRCHDHKFDPLSQADHFRLRAFFEGVTFADQLPLDLAPEQEAIKQQNAGLEAQIQPLEQTRKGVLDQAKGRVIAERLAQLSADDRQFYHQHQTNPPTAKADRTRHESLRRKVEPSDKEIRQAVTAEEKQRTEALANQIKELRGQLKPLTHGLLMTDSEGPIPPTRILFQGDHKSPREPVEPGFLSILDPNPAKLVQPAHPKTSGRRLTLAHWITSTSNPLSARVLVNRVWQSHFGRGLVGTPNDFGIAGARPSHPELLDWLARRFQTSGWSLKQLHRLVVLSATYRQSSQLAAPGAAESTASSLAEMRYDRQSLRRLTAEQLHDALLFTSGRLMPHTGGPPVWPELPPAVLQANPAFLDDNAEKTKGWYPSPPGMQDVRSVYLVQKRTVRVPFLETFDLPENSTSCALRTQSIVPPQAFALLNSDLAVRSARSLAERVERAAPRDPRDQVRAAFQLAFQRSPSEAELADSEQLLNRRSLVELCRVLLNLNEFIFLD